MQVKISTPMTLWQFEDALSTYEQEHTVSGALCWVMNPATEREVRGLLIIPAHHPLDTIHGVRVVTSQAINQSAVYLIDVGAVARNFYEE